MTRRRSAGLKASVFRLQGGRCAYCGKPMSLDHDDIECLATWDEVVPRARGGSTQAHNTVLACLPCNARKGSDIWEPLPDIARREARNRLPYDYDDA